MLNDKKFKSLIVLSNIELKQKEMYLLNSDHGVFIFMSEILEIYCRSIRVCRCLKVKEQNKWGYSKKEKLELIELVCKIAT